MYTLPDDFMNNKSYFCYFNPRPAQSGDHCHQVKSHIARL
jgi:hypothetical protein